MNITVTDFTKYENNTLRGFVTVSFSDSISGRAITISGFTLHQKGNRWLEFPSKQDKNGAYIKVKFTYDSRDEKEIKNVILKDLDRYLEEEYQDEI
jgi:DNA-binding cell septation regulator SpoVG